MNGSVNSDPYAMSDVLTLTFIVGFVIGAALGLICGFALAVQP